METVAKRGDEANTRAAAALAIGEFEALGDDWGLSAVLYHFGWALGRFGRWSESADVLDRAIRVAGDAGIYNTVQWASADRGSALLALGRVDEARASFARAGAVSDRVGDHAGAALTRYGNAVLAYRDGRYADARTLYRQVLQDFQTLGVRVATGLTLAGLGACDEALHDEESARADYRRLLQVGDTDGDIGLVATALEGLARVYTGPPERAAQLLGHAEQLRTTHDRPLSPEEQDRVEAASAALRAVLGEQRYQSARSRGARTRPEIG
jgi:tetratricopeptide (TPR) repeat protein